MPDHTITIDKKEKVFAPLAITATEKSYELAHTDTFVIQMVSDVAWWFAYETAGPYYPIGALTPFTFKGFPVTRNVYVKTQSGTGTLYGVLIE